jgi:exodeoxyribonuclease VII small subunit
MGLYAPPLSLTAPMSRAMAARMADPASHTIPDIAAMSFEDALRALEDVVRKLESGDVPLDDSINLYARGEDLRRHCQARLDAASARIERIVSGPDGQPIGTRPLDGPEA